MVSALWKACSEGNVDEVYEILKDVSIADIEVRDHTGATPLIEAVKNGHITIVRALLERGANPMNPSHHGPPSQYTADPAILELLHPAQMTPTHVSPMPHQNGFVPEVNGDANGFYGAPTYEYYSPPANMPEGAPYYAHPPQNPNEVGPGMNGGNLPPADIARFIPCRYFPACRYGASCLFMHPTGPYFPAGLPPPAQYPAPYDPMAPQPYPSGYYSPPYQPNGVPHMPPMSSPSAPINHIGTPSDMTPSHFSPNGAPPAPFSPMSPPSFPEQAPMQMPGPPYSEAQSSLPVQFPSQPELVNGPYAVPVPAMAPFPELNGTELPVEPIPEPYGHPLDDGMASGQRRYPVKRLSAARKPPCLFFPAGKCKNGNDCRFPHVLPDSGMQQPFVNGRPPPRRYNGNGNGNGYPSLEDKLNGLNLRDDQQRPNGLPGRPYESRRPFSATNGRPSYAPGRRPGPPKQRVPQDDEFPSLAGNAPIKGVINGHTGPTAAQILQRPAPTRTNSTRGSNTRSPSPDEPRSLKSEENGHANLPHAPVAVKLPVTFAAAIVAATPGPDTIKEVFVSA